MRRMILCTTILWFSGPVPYELSLSEYLNHPDPVTKYKTHLRAENRKRTQEVNRYIRIMESFVIGTPDPEVLREIGRAVYDDANITGLPPEFYLALMRVENPWLDPWIENWYGAVGITQVVPRYWEGVYPECGEDLNEIRTQVCYGARIYLHYLDSWGGDPNLALYAYNGCTLWHRQTQQRCLNYPNWIQDYEEIYRENF